MVQNEDCFEISDVEPAIKQGARDRVAVGRIQSGNAGILGLPSWEFFKPFIVTGLALGGVYALSRGRDGRALPGDRGAEPGVRSGRRDGGVHRVVADRKHHPRRTGRLRRLHRRSGASSRCCTACCSARRWPRATRSSRRSATLGLALILLGAMSWIWTDKARSMILPTTNWGFEVGGVLVNWTQVIALVLGVVVTVVTGAVPAVHETRHGDAGAGRRPRDHGDARRARAARRGFARGSAAG